MDVINLFWNEMFKLFICPVGVVLIFFFQFFNFKFKKRFDGGLESKRLVFLPQLTTRAAYQ